MIRKKASKPVEVTSDPKVILKKTVNHPFAENWKCFVSTQLALIRIITNIVGVECTAGCHLYTPLRNIKVRKWVATPNTQLLLVFNHYGIPNQKVANIAQRTSISNYSGEKRPVVRKLSAVLLQEWQHFLTLFHQIQIGNIWT